jgi:hypothetical protein
MHKTRGPIAIGVADCFDAQREYIRGASDFRDYDRRRSRCDPVERSITREILEGQQRQPVHGQARRGRAGRQNQQQRTSGGAG